jgi:asparagine synthase (glutamine-hydrolysing)
MCGIAGLIEFASGRAPGALVRRAQAMADALAHRGPDGADVWCDTDAGLALSHRRLAIVDLTPTGVQPMVSSDGRWVISYNGEVYNAETVAADMKMTGFIRRGTSDTEIIVESIARRGLDRTLADLNGMFAIALWDRVTRTLHLVRDRVGIKPLFYSETDDGFFFASELKGLLAAGVALEIDEASITGFLRFGYVPTPRSIYRNVAKVEPGQIVSFTPSGGLRRTKYWSLEKIVQNGLNRPFTGSDGQAEETLHDLLADAVSINMISDVPLGTFLSGGIDSSTVAALMVAARRGPVRTFSIGFPDFGYDEAPHARSVANHLGTRHQELVVTAADALAVVPQLADMYDEPFADSSQIPTYAISRLTRAHVTVALSGDGGDEVFAGYYRHRLAAGWFPRLAAWPRSLRRIVSSGLQSIPDGAVDILSRILPLSMRVDQPADKLKKLSDILALDGDAAYLHLVSQCHDPAVRPGGMHEPPVSLKWPESPVGLLERMQFWDLTTYLPDDILQKVDRASMAVSLEVRPPLLDHRVVEFAWTLPLHLRVRGGETKWLLRRVLDRYVPRNLVSRPKAGFAIPLASWLRGPLRDWAEDLLDSRRLAGGALDAAVVRRLWLEHVAGHQNHAHALWAILMFESWRRRWMGKDHYSGRARLPVLASAGSGG